MLRLLPNVTYTGTRGWRLTGACRKAIIGIVAATAPIATSTLRWSHAILPQGCTKIILRRVSGFAESRPALLVLLRSSCDFSVQPRRPFIAAYRPRLGQ